MLERQQLGMEGRVWWRKSMKSGGKSQGTSDASSPAVVCEGRHKEEVVNCGYLAAAWSLSVGFHTDI